MKKSTERWMSIVGCIILGLNVFGAAAILISNAVHKSRYHRDLLATRDLTLQFAGPQNVELQDAHAYVRKDGLVVSGCLNRVGSAAGPVASQVDIRLLSAMSSVLEEETIRDLSRCKRGGVHFDMRFKTVPSDGSVLNIRATVNSEVASTPNRSSGDSSD